MWQMNGVDSLSTRLKRSWKKSKVMALCIHEPSFLIQRMFLKIRYGKNRSHVSSISMSSCTDEEFAMWFFLFSFLFLLSNNENWFHHPTLWLFLQCPDEQGCKRMIFIAFEQYKEAGTRYLLEKEPRSKRPAHYNGCHL